MHIAGWLAPLLLCVAVFCLALPNLSATAPPRVTRALPLLALICAVVAAALFLARVVTT